MRVPVASHGNAMRSLEQRSLTLLADLCYNMHNSSFAEVAMAGNGLENGRLVQIVITMAVVVFGLFLIKTGAKLLYKHYELWRGPTTNPLTRNLVAGVLLIALGILTLISFFTQSIFFTTLVE